MPETKSISKLRRVVLYTFSFFFFILGYFGFMQVGWLFSQPISEFKQPVNEAPVVVPDDAKSFMVNHGNFIFFTDTPSENPTKSVVIILMILVGIGTSISINIYIVLKDKKAKKETTPELLE